MSFNFVNVSIILRLCHFFGFKVFYDTISFVVTIFLTTLSVVSFTGEALYGAIIDLFIAGSETTSNSLNWCILYMQEFPEIQKRCQEEIFEVNYVKLYSTIV